MLLTVPAPPLSVRSRERIAHTVLVATAVVAVAVTVPEAPAMTATHLADQVWMTIAAVVAVAAGSSSRRSSWIVAAVLVLVVAGTGIALLLTGAALALGVVAVVVDRRVPLVGGVVGALVVAASVRLPGGLVRGLPSVLAVGAILWLCGSSFRLARRGTQRTLRFAAVGAGVVLMGAALGLLAAGGSAMRSVDAASAELRASVRAASGDDRALSDHLAAADRELQRAQSSMAGPASRAADVLPILGRQSAALREVTEIGADLGETSAAVVGVADYKRLEMTDQQIDLDAVAEMEDPLREVLRELRRADGSIQAMDLSWLVAPLDDRIRGLHEEVREAIPSTELALEVIDVAPALLGAEGPRHYLLAFTQPSEARGLGGFMGNWAELTAVDGRLELFDSGRAEDLNLAPGFEDRVLRGPADYIERYGSLHIERFLQDVTFSPHMPSVSEVLADQYEQTTGRPIDGVIVVDPIAMAAMLEVTGPVNIPQLDVPLDHTNAADFLLTDQYLQVGDREERIDALAEASRRTFQRLLHRRVLEPGRMGRILGPPVDDGRLLAWSRHPAEQQVIELLGLDGSFEVPEGGELMSVVSQNSGNNKIDAYLRRTVGYELAWDPTTGEVAGTVTVVLHNVAPADGMPTTVIGNRPSLGLPDGTNAQILTISTGGIGSEVRVDGVAVPVRTGVERGTRAYSVEVAVPAQGTVEVTMEVATAVTPGGELVLRWDGQPLPVPDEVAVSVTVAGRWAIDAGRWAPHGAGDRSHTFRAHLRSDR